MGKIQYYNNLYIICWIIWMFSNTHRINFICPCNRIIDTRNECGIFSNSMIETMIHFILKNINNTFFFFFLHNNVILLILMVIFIMHK